MKERRYTGCAAGLFWTVKHAYVLGLCGLESVCGELMEGHQNTVQSERRRCYYGQKEMGLLCLVILFSVCEVAPAGAALSSNDYVDNESDAASLR